MAVQADIITSVRRRVRDLELPQTYVDAYYIDAIDFALKKLNFDFANDPEWMLATVPTRYEFLLIKLATIEMCYVRGGEVIDSDSGAGIASISVPNLSVSEGKDDSDESKFWLDLADKLQKEYDGELKSAGGGPDGSLGKELASSHVVMRTGYRTGRRVPLDIHRPITAPVPTLTQLALSVLVTWTPVRDLHFYAYEVYRVIGDGSRPVSVKDPLTTERLAQITDIHEDRYEDGDASMAVDDVNSYVICVYDKNGLRSQSVAVEITIA